MVDGGGAMDHFNKEFMYQFLQLSQLMRFICIFAVSITCLVALYAIYIEIKGR